jgi:hypothetical protein
VGLFVVGFRPLRRMIGMGVVEADDIFSALAAFALDAHQFLGIDVVAIVSGIGARVAAAGSARDDAAAVLFEATKENAAAFVRISLFAVAAKGVVVIGVDLQHRERHFTTESQRHRERKRKKLAAYPQLFANDLIKFFSVPLCLRGGLALVS